jgi:hypothetical protein
MTAATDFYISSSWRFRQITLLVAAHFVAVSLIQAPVSMAQLACNTSGYGEKSTSTTMSAKHQLGVIGRQLPPAPD